MKKLALSSVLVIAAAGAAFGQGAVEWNAIVPSYFTAVTNTSASSYLSVGGVKSLQGGSTGSTVAVAGAFYYELLFTASGASAPTSTAGLEGWTDSGLEGESAASAGRATVLNGTTGATVASMTQNPTTVMLVGWSANLGTTWSAASAILESTSALATFDATGAVPLFGESSVGTITPASGGSSIGAAVFGPAANGTIYSLSTPLYPVTAAPEPTTIALGVVGGLSLLALRRKKA